MVKLTNGSLSASVNESGAEICSLTDVASGLEYIWQAGSTWPKHAPLLFPIVGTLRDNNYIYEGNIYKMDRHGFARNKLFSLMHADSATAVFELMWSDETLLVYPFRFRLAVTYSLKEDGLTVSYNTENLGDKPMFFSIGAHPAFRVPLRDNESYEDYVLVFNRKENSQRWALRDGLIGKPVGFFNNQNELKLSHALFEKDALVFKGLHSDMISIRSRNHANGIDFHFKDYPYFGIWAARNADFVCLEPWHGIADSENASQDLASKEGIMKLEPGGQFACSFDIKIY